MPRKKKESAVGSREFEAEFNRLLQQNKAAETAPAPQPKPAAVTIKAQPAVGAPAKANRIESLKAAQAKILAERSSDEAKLGIAKPKVDKAARAKERSQEQVARTQKGSFHPTRQVEVAPVKVVKGKKAIAALPPSESHIMATSHMGAGPSASTNVYLAPKPKKARGKAPAPIEVKERPPVLGPSRENSYGTGKQAAPAQRINTEFNRVATEPGRVAVAQRRNAPASFSRGGVKEAKVAPATKAPEATRAPVRALATPASAPQASVKSEPKAKAPKPVTVKAAPAPKAAPAKAVKAPVAKPFSTLSPDGKGFFNGKPVSGKAAPKAEVPKAAAPKATPEAAKPRPRPPAAKPAAPPKPPKAAPKPRVAKPVVAPKPAAASPIPAPKGARARGGGLEGLAYLAGTAIAGAVYEKFKQSERKKKK